MKISEARARAQEMQEEATHLIRAASALNAACDAHRLNNADHDPDVHEISASDVGKSLDDNARARLQKAIDDAVAAQATPSA